MTSPPPPQVITPEQRVLADEIEMAMAHPDPQLALGLALLVSQLQNDLAQINTRVENLEGAIRP